MKHTTAPGPKTLDPSMGLRTAPSATSTEWSPQSGRSASAPRALVTVARRALHARFSWSSSWSSSASALDGRASARACVQLASATATSSDSPTSAANVNPHDSARVRARARSSGRAKRARAPRWPEPGERSRRASSSAVLAQLTRAGEPARGALPADFPNRRTFCPRGKRDGAGCRVPLRRHRCQTISNASRKTLRGCDSGCARTMATAARRSFRLAAGTKDPAGTMGGEVPRDMVRPLAVFAVLCGSAYPVVEL
jgi:hypothetical protein